EGQQEFSLPPVDGGKDARTFLAAAFMSYSPNPNHRHLGFPFAFGVFQEYYSTHPPFQGSGNIAVIGTCAMGIMYVSAPLVFAGLQRFPKTQRPAIGFGLVTMCLALGLSALSTTTTHLIITQGIFYALGGSLVYSSTILFMNEWFVKRKGLAFGVMLAGTGLGGVTIPLLLQFLLAKYGYKTTLIVWAVILFVAAAPLSYSLRPRLPVSQASRLRPVDFSFLLTRNFLFLQVGNILQGLGYFIPSIYLPTHARMLGASHSISALTIVLFNLAMVFGCLAMGAWIDRYHVTTCVLISSIGSTIAVFVLWGLSSSPPVLFVFAVFYGFFAGSFSSTYPGIMRAVNLETQRDPNFIFAFLSAGRGIGNMASGPVSEILVRSGAWKGETGGAYGSGYGSLIVFTGVTAALGGLGIFGRLMK
ncbi:MFS monocarboxylate transporter, partial [Lophium mytilinum]